MSSFRSLAVAVAGLLFVQFGLLDRSALGPDDRGASAVGARRRRPRRRRRRAAGDDDRPTEPADGRPRRSDGEAPSLDESGGMTQLEAELESTRSSCSSSTRPTAAVDPRRRARRDSGADDVNAGFVAVNAPKENQIGDLALEYDLRETPAVLVFRRGPSS